MDKELQTRRRLFEQQLQAAEEEGEGDVLKVWHSLISWLEERKSSYSMQKHYTMTLQKCLTYFAEMPQYNGDSTLVEIYFKSARMCTDPSVIYKHMLAQKIGTHFAMLYTTVADHLVECDLQDEAIRTVEQGISSKAQPVKVLQKHLEALKKSKSSQSAAASQSRSSQSAATSQTRSSQSAAVSQTSTALPRVDDQSERNEEFYSHPQGTKLCYPKQLIYPPEGGDISLEHLRANLPQYYCKGESSLLCMDEEEHMEMTVAYTSNITMHIPADRMAISSCIRESKSSPPLDPSSDILPPEVPGVTDKENVMDKENPAKDPSVISKQKRHPLLIDRTDELERLNSEKKSLMAARADVPSSRQLQVDGDALLEKELEQLVLQKPNRKPLAELSHGGADHHGGLDTDTCFGFTPSTLEGDVNWPVSGTKSGNAFVTKLSFSEADSLSHSTSRLDSTTDGRSTTAHSGFFNATLDCEKRGKLTQEQLAIERQFANSPENNGESLIGVSMASWKGQSLSNSQSFDVFHDSWVMNQSKNTSQQQTKPKHPAAFKPSSGTHDVFGMNQSANTSQQQQQRKNLSAFEPYDEAADPFKPCGVVRPTRKPLQEMAVSKPLMMRDAMFDEDDDLSRDQSYSFQPSHSNMSSFSVFEDTKEQSSFVPFHDSWSRNASGVNPGGKLVPPTLPKEDAPVDEGVYYAPVGVPLMSHDHEQLNLTELTQFDIPHPAGNTGPASTPMREHINLKTLDISVVPSAETKHQPVATTKPHSNTATNHHPPPHQQQQQPATNNAYRRSYLCYPSALTVISEESRSFKSSGSNSTSSSASSHMTSSSSSSSSAPLYSGPVEVNPFLPQNVNLMLNTLIDATPSVVKVKGQVPRIVCGRSLLLGNSDEFEVRKKIAEGGFAKLYTAKQDGEIKALKVQSPPLEWEMAILNELHKRLGPGVMSQNFLQFNKAFLYNDASVLVTSYFACGSLLDFVNVCRKGHSIRMEENFLLYLVREMVSTVAALHQCGIVHTDIKPDNFMIRDIRTVSGLTAAKGMGLCLIDFGRAVDTKAFHEDTMFVGSCETEGFQCTQMLENKPWKWQADYFGIAATCHVLMFGEYMQVIKDPQTGVYKYSSKIQRHYDVTFWSKLFLSLINAPDVVPLMDVVSLFDGRLRAVNDAIFMRQVKIYFGKLLGQ